MWPPLVVLQGVGELRHQVKQGRLETPREGELVVQEPRARGATWIRLGSGFLADGDVWERGMECRTGAR